MTRASAVLTLALFGLLAAATPARADITAFIGTSPTPNNHGVRGFSGGIGLLIVGFEFEYAHISEDELEALPSLKTWSGNVLAQTPMDILGMQLYATIGAGGYREFLQAGTATPFQETNAAINTGGGAKIKLIGPIRVRVDYRIFKLQGNPINTAYQRFYVGGNLKF